MPPDPDPLPPEVEAPLEGSMPPSPPPSPPPTSPVTSSTSSSPRKPASRGTPSEGRRVHPFVIRMTEIEYAEMTRQAGRVHLEKAAYVRARVFGYKVPSQRNAIDEENYRDLSHLVLDFRNLGANVNQIAHHLNLGQNANVTQTLETLVRAREALDRVRIHLVRIAEDFETENLEVPEALEWEGD